MDVVSMLMGGAVVAVLWIFYHPSAKLRRLRELEAAQAERTADQPRP